MQQDLKAAAPDLNIEIIGMNLTNKAAFNSAMTSGRTIPWLQDTVEDHARQNWGALNDEIWILDWNNRLYAKYDLLAHNLQLTSNRAELRALFLAAAKAPDTDNDKLWDDWEVLNFGSLDAEGDSDPDGDGFDNFTEFAFGTDPNEANSRPSMPYVLTEQRTFIFSFNRRAGNMVDYLPEFTTDLVNWDGTLNPFIYQGPARNLFDGSGMSEVIITLSAQVEENRLGIVRLRPVPRGGN